MERRFKELPFAGGAAKGFLFSGTVSSSGSSSSGSALSLTLSAVPSSGRFPSVLELSALSLSGSSVLSSVAGSVSEYSVAGWTTSLSSSSSAKTEKGYIPPIITIAISMETVLVIALRIFLFICTPIWTIAVHSLFIIPSKTTCYSEKGISNMLQKFMFNVIYEQNVYEMLKIEHL